MMVDSLEAGALDRTAGACFIKRLFFAASLLVYMFAWGCRGVVTNARDIADLSGIQFLDVVTSTVTIDRDAGVLCDGVDAARITVTLFDNRGVPLPGLDVRLLVTGAESSLTPDSGKSDASGAFSATLVSLAAGPKTVTAIVSDADTQHVLLQEPTVVFAPVQRMLSFVSSPGDAVAGEAFATVKVAMTFSSGAPVPETAATIALTLVAGTAGAVLDGGSSQQPSAGIATFGDLRTNQAGIGYRLRANAEGFSAAESAPFSVFPSAPVGLAFVSPPKLFRSGLIGAFGVAVVDRFGNLLPDTRSITVAVSTNPVGALLGGTPTRSAVDGIATFDDLNLDEEGAGFVLTASAAGLAPVHSEPLTTPREILFALMSRRLNEISPGEDAATLERVDVGGATSAALASIDLGARYVTSLAVDATGGRLYVADNGADSVLAMDLTGSSQSSRAWPNIVDLALSPDGSELYGVGDQLLRACGVAPFATASCRDVDFVPYAARSIAVAPDGSVVAAVGEDATTGDAVVSFVAAATFSEIHRTALSSNALPCAAAPSQWARNPGTVVFAGNGTVVVHDADCRQLTYLDVATGGELVTEQTAVGEESLGFAVFNNTMVYSAPKSALYLWAESAPSQAAAGIFESIALSGVASPILSDPLAGDILHVPVLSSEGLRLFVPIVRAAGPDSLDLFSLDTRVRSPAVFTFPVHPSTTPGSLHLRDAQVHEVGVDRL